MFIVNTLPQIYYDPWEISFQDRFKALSKGQQRVAYFYERPDNSTFRYRVYNMIQALEASPNGISASYFTNNDWGHLDKVVDSADILVICRFRYTDKLNRLITRAKNKGKRVFFDIDDLVFDVDDVHLVLNTLDQDLSHPLAWDTWYAAFSRLGATLKLCDAVLTTNEYLASEIRRRCNKNTFVIPNFLNQAQLDISSLVFQEKKSKGYKRNNQIHLGYFSGTPTHNRDFALLSDALSKILDEDSQVFLRLVGFMELKGRIKNYSSQIEFYPLHDFVNLQRLISLVEINLIPLQNNVFTNCKSDLKYFESGIVGTTSIASPVFTYSQSIREGVNGYIASSFEWYDKIKFVISTVSTNLYTEIAERANIDCELRYAWYNQVDLIEKTLFFREISSSSIENPKYDHIILDTNEKFDSLS